MKRCFETPEMHDIVEISSAPANANATLPNKLIEDCFQIFGLFPGSI